MSKSGRHILVIPSWYPPDGGQFFQDQAQALAEQGFRVDVLVNRIVGLSKVRRSHAYTYKRFHVSEAGDTRVIRSACMKWPRMEMLNVHRWIRSTLRLFRRYEKRFGAPDLILVHSFMWAGYAAARIQEKYGIPYILVEHRSRFTLSPGEAGELLKPAYRPFIEKAFTGAAKLVTVSESLQPAIRGYLSPGEEEKLQTIPNLVDTDLFSPGEERRGKKDPLMVLSVGRLDPEKGMDVLISAFEGLKQEMPDSELIIVGDGPERERLERLVAQSGLEESVQFRGKLSPVELVKVFQSASFFALASRFEAFGVVFIEAMSTGLPVVATRAGGPQTFIPEFAGVLVGVDQEGELAQAMLRMAGQLDEYDSGRIRQYTREKFSKESVSLQYARLINSLLDD